MSDKQYHSGYEDLFDYLSHNHGLNMLQSEMSDLIHFVHKFQPQPQGAVWVKASVRLPEQTKRPVLYIVKWYDDKMYVRTMTANQLADVAKRNLIDYLWLDESGTTSNKEQEMEFAEWSQDKAVFHSQEKIWYTWGYTQPIGTTAQLHDLWQQSKKKP